MLGVGKWLRKGAALAALGLAGAVGAIAETRAERGWSADPDEQFLLDVNLRQFRLGDGVRAYNTPEGTCVLFGDFLTAIDVPVSVDLAAKKANGWAFTEQNRIAIDAASGVVRYGSKEEPLAAGAIRQTPDGWCVDTAALARWFGIGVKPLTSGSALLLESEAKLPVELAMERQQRAARLTTAKFDMSSLPQVRLPYRLWRAPALDFVVSAGTTYQAGTGVKVDRRASVYAAGEIARLSYDAQIATNQKAQLSALRVRAYRSDPEAGLLGPLHATHFGGGDVAGFGNRLGGGAASGRGVIVTNRPLFNPASFDRMRFEGDLPAGWDAEIYRNGELLAFARPTPDQRYLFEDVQLLYGENRISIVLYGPHGQVRSRDELINVGQDNVPAGKTWYWAGANQPGRDLLDFGREGGTRIQPQAQATLALEHGVDARTSVGALARMMLIEDEQVTFVEGSVRRSIGSAIVEVGGGRDSGGGTAARAQVLARLGSANVSAEALIADDFHLQAGPAKSIKDVRVALDAPLRLGRTVVPAHADVRLAEQADGTRELEAAGRLASNFNRFNLGTELRYRRQLPAHGPAPPGIVELSTLGTGRIGDVRLRGQASAVVMPQARFRAAELSAYWSASDRADWEGALAYEGGSGRARARLTHVRRLDSVAVALIGEAASDGSLALGLNLNFSLDASRGFTFTRQPLAGAGAVRARVYRDLNDNGRRDLSEPFERGALITTGTRVSERPTDAKGAVLIGGLATFTPVAVGVDTTSLSDLMLVPRKALQVVVPRPGVPAEVEIGLVGAGDVEGAILKSGGIGFEGLAIELVDSAGKVAASTQTDFDGFFLFERVAYGTYGLRVARESAAAAGIAPELDAQVVVSPGQSVVRLGALQATPLPKLASSE